MKIAALSDIHGNTWALEAVLHEIEDHKPDVIVNLGDSLYGPLDPMGTFSILRSLGIETVAGNEDRLIIEKYQECRTLDYVLNELNDDALYWLVSLPRVKSLEHDILMCHGTPNNDSVYLLEKVGKTGIYVRSPEETDKILENVWEHKILCGHSHLPRIVKTPGKLIINPGSVGCPAFEDDTPFFHKIENQNPDARFAILDYTEGGIIVEHVKVPYDNEKAAKLAEKNRRPDWAKWLRTGRT